MTARNNKGKIVQFSYGDNNMDTIRVEEQHLPFIEMSTDDIYSHYHIYTEKDNKVLVKPFTKSVQKRLNKEKEETNKYCLEYINRTLTSQNIEAENVKWKMKMKVKYIHL